jgi:fructosamine-3-kinase
VSFFARRVAALTGVAEERLQRLAGGDLSEVLRFRRADGAEVVAKGGPGVATEAAMLRALLGAGIAAPRVESEFEGVLILQFVPNDAVFSRAAWASIGRTLAQLHARTADNYGWPVDHRLGTVELDNRQGGDWPSFWGGQRLAATAALLDRPWRERVGGLTPRLRDLLPPAPPAAWLHGDLWSGNILVADGRLAALIDPACYHGDPEVDLAMLTLFDTPPEPFWAAYGPMEPGWEARRPIYQLFPALVHFRLFGPSYGGMVDRLLTAVGA